MNTAMKAMSNMVTPPTMGNTTGINGTIASTPSGSTASGWSEWAWGADMANSSNQVKSALQRAGWLYFNCLAHNYLRWLAALPDLLVLPAVAA
jgi:hypothetical protein